MIKVGDIIRIKDYDYEEQGMTKKKWRVLEVYPYGVLCSHIKGIYKTFWNTAHLIENGYVPNFEDVKVNEGYMASLDRYVNGNKLLNGY